MRSTTSLFAALVFLTACGEMPAPTDGGLPTNDTGPVDAGPRPDAELPDAGPSPDAMVEPDAPEMPEIDLSTEEGFCEAYATMLCAAWEVCGTCDAPTASCVETMTGRCLRPPTPRPGAYHPEDAPAYLGLLEDTFATCEWPSPVEHRVLYPYHGEQEDGTSCTSNGDCSSGHCAAANVGDPLTCFVPWESNERTALCR